MTSQCLLILNRPPSACDLEHMGCDVQHTIRMGLHAFVNGAIGINTVRSTSIGCILAVLQNIVLLRSAT